MKFLRAVFVCLSFLFILSSVQPVSVKANPICTTETWTNTDPNTNSVPYVYWRKCLNNGLEQFYIQVFGKCHPQNCDWGSRRAHQDPAGYRAFYVQGVARRHLTFGIFGSRMTMNIKSTYTDGRVVNWELAFQK
ncbi:MAG: hypothetical protein ACRBBN_03380 [Methyloligellaceae bacterium]